MPKKRFSIIASLLILLVGLSSLFAEAVITEFRGEPGVNKVTLKWATLSESNLKGFEIERSLNNKNFQKVGFVAGAGNSSTKKNYSFVDKTVYKSTTSRTFYYRLKIVNNNGTSYIWPQVVSVKPSISGAKYTWGSIKAMFR